MTSPLNAAVVPVNAPVSVPPLRGSLVASATVMFAEPLNETPLMVRAVCRVVAVAALPVVFWLPAMLTPGKLMLAEPLKLTPPIVLAVCRVVAVAALPVVLAEEPVMLILQVPLLFVTNCVHAPQTDAEVA